MRKSIPRPQGIEKPGRGDPPRTHRNEFPTGYSLAGRSPALPASASPAKLILQLGAHILQLSQKRAQSTYTTSHKLSHTPFLNPINDLTRLLTPFRQFHTSGIIDSRSRRNHHDHSPQKLPSSGRRQPLVRRRPPQARHGVARRSPAWIRWTASSLKSARYGFRLLFTIVPPL